MIYIVTPEGLDVIALRLVNGKGRPEAAFDQDGKLRPLRSAGWPRDLVGGCALAVRIEAHRACPLINALATPCAGILDFARAFRAWSACNPNSQHEGPDLARGGP